MCHGPLGKHVARASRRCRWLTLVTVVSTYGNSICANRAATTGSDLLCGASPRPARRLHPALLLLLALAPQARPADTIILDCAHESQILHETRHYRIFLPPAYESSTTRYPVIYWFHGFGERYNQGPANKEYDRGDDYNGDNLANFVSHNDVVIVKLDGYNPRAPKEDYPRPYNIGPVETDRQFPLYFPELVAHIDANYRTIPDRDHRATAGLSMGGFMSYWIAGKYPDLVSSASNFMGSSEFVVGPRKFPVEYRHDEMAANYGGVRTRLITGTQDFIQFYHRQMNLIWKMPTHETENFDSDHGTPGMAKTLAFHMNAFADPLPRPEIWSHADVYPNFSVWDWTVETDRTRPGITSIDSASHTGFHSRVQQWFPGGKTLQDVHLKITTAPLYKKKSRIQVTTIRLRDNKIQHEHVFTDDVGRLELELDGDEYQVRIGGGLVKRSVETFKLPQAPVTTDFQIADQRTLAVFQHAVKPRTVTLGQGNGDGKANRGEQIAILFPDGDAFRAAELISDDDCVDLTTRISDNWSDYDQVGASAKYTLARISQSCPNHTIKILAKVIFPNKPNHQLREFTIELPIIPLP
jgi:S-formylglutathione hydrolase FrmB